MVGVKDEVAGVSGNLYFAKTDADGNTGCNLTVNSIVSIPPTIVGPVTANGTSIPTVTNITPIVYGGADINTICASCSITATITPSGDVSFCSGTSLTLLANAGTGSAAVTPGPRTGDGRKSPYCLSPAKRNPRLTLPARQPPPAGTPGRLSATG